MVLKLDPLVPIVWRSPFSMQFGVDARLVVLPDVSTAQEHMVAALTSGVSRSGLSMIGRAAGGDESEVAQLLDALRPVLEQTREAVARRVTVAGLGPTVNLLAQALAEAGMLVSADRAPCELAVAVGHFVLDPDSYGYWLRRDVPHLPVIFGDSGVTVGPMVEPGSGPCLYCIERYRTEADPAWPAIASQLWGRRSATETRLVSIEVAAIVARIAVDRMSHGPAAAASSIRLDARTGELERREWLPHPGCGCVTVPGAARPETGSPDGPDRGVIPLRPRKARASAAPA